MEFKHTTLSNGLKIVGEVNDAAQTAAIGFFVRTGSRDETDAISGVSHFLEHMMFKGTNTMSALEVNESFDRLGAEFMLSPDYGFPVYPETDPVPLSLEAVPNGKVPAKHYFSKFYIQCF